MTFDDYSAMVRDYHGIIPSWGENLIYPALGLAGEAGEVAEKIKKLWRNQGQRSGKQISSAEDRTALVKRTWRRAVVRGCDEVRNCRW